MTSRLSARRYPAIAAFLAAVAFLIICLSHPFAYAWQGKVVGVSDGDTITVMHLKH